MHLTYSTRFEPQTGCKNYLNSCTSGVLFDKIAVAQLVKIFPHFIEPGGSLAAFTIACHWSLY